MRTALVITALIALGWITIDAITCAELARELGNRSEDVSRAQAKAQAFEEKFPRLAWMGNPFAAGAHERGEAAADTGHAPAAVAVGDMAPADADILPPMAADTSYSKETNGKLAVHTITDMSQSFIDSFEVARKMTGHITGEIAEVPFEFHVWPTGNRVYHLGPYTYKTIDRMVYEWPEPYRGKGVSWSEWSAIVNRRMDPRNADWRYLDDQWTNLTEGLRQSLSYAIPQAREGYIATVFVLTDAKHDPPPGYNDAKYRGIVQSQLAAIPEKYRSRLRITVVPIGGNGDPNIVQRDILGNYPGAVTTAAGSWSLVEPVIRSQLNELVGGWGWEELVPDELAWYPVPAQDEPLVIERTMNLRGPDSAVFEFVYSVQNTEERSEGDLALLPDEFDKLAFKVVGLDGEPIIDPATNLARINNGDKVRFVLYENPENSFGGVVKHAVSIELRPRGTATILKPSPNTAIAFGVERGGFADRHPVLLGIIITGGMASFAFVVIAAMWLKGSLSRKDDSVMENQAESELSGSVSWKGDAYQLSGSRMEVGGLKFGLYPSGLMWVRSSHPSFMVHHDSENLGNVQKDIQPNEDTLLPDVDEIRFVTAEEGGAQSDMYELFDYEMFGDDSQNLNGRLYVYRKESTVG